MDPRYMIVAALGAVLAAGPALAQSSLDAQLPSWVAPLDETYVTSGSSDAGSDILPAPPAGAPASVEKPAIEQSAGNSGTLPDAPYGEATTTTSASLPAAPETVPIPEEKPEIVETAANAPVASGFRVPAAYPGKADEGLDVEDHDHGARGNSAYGSMNSGFDEAPGNSASAPGQKKKAMYGVSRSKPKKAKGPRHAKGPKRGKGKKH